MTNNKIGLDFFNKIINKDVIHFSKISGGCINECFKIESNQKKYFIKINSSFNPFNEEKKGLKLLESTNTFTIPKVYEVGVETKTAFLLMEFIDGKIPSDDFWISFGYKLAKMHSHSNKFFGLDYNNYIGSLSQENTQHRDAIEFFINCRLLPQIRLISKSSNNQLFKRFDKLFSKLSEILPNDKPALIHGDLWNGNFMVDISGAPVLVDPAVYYGSREIDIAMSKLFGGFSNQFYESYNEKFPLEKDWQSRVDIWNLYPLLVHANLFGDSYLNQVNFILKKFN